jgi:hypothetical protein
MGALIPLLQTILWVGLIVWLIHRYNAQVVAILTSIQDRVAKGSSVKAGPFELGQDIRPQDAQEQKNRLEEEIQQLGEPPPGPQLLPPGEGSQSSRLDLQKRYLLAEDLVMRELQIEFGAPVNRQIRVGGVELDGMFAKEGSGYGIEVKYVRRRVTSDRLIDSLTRLQSSLQRLGWRRFTLILALVCESDEPISPSDIERIQARLSQLGVPVMVRVYTLQSLADKFGIDLNAP